MAPPPTLVPNAGLASTTDCPGLHWLAKAMASIKWLAWPELSENPSYTVQSKFINQKSIKKIQNAYFIKKNMWLLKVPYGSENCIQLPKYSFIFVHDPGHTWKHQHDSTCIIMNIHDPFKNIQNIHLHTSTNIYPHSFFWRVPTVPKFYFLIFSVSVLSRVLPSHVPSGDFLASKPVRIVVC